MLHKKNKKKEKTIGYYVLLILTCIFIFIGIFIFDYFSNIIGLNHKEKSLFLLWLLEIIIFISVFYGKRRWLIFKIKIILSINVIFLTSIYLGILWLIDYNGYEIIPIISVRQLTHFILLGLIITFINEFILLKYLKTLFKENKSLENNFK